MRQWESRLASSTSLLISLITIVAVGLTAVPVALATPVVTEDILSIQRIDQHPDVLQLVTTHLTVPAQARWETDPDAGPLSFTVETGVLGVMLGGGSARIERQSNLLLGERVGPLEPGRQTELRPRDRLVIVRGFQLTVTNDGDEPASAVVVRLRQASSQIAGADQ